MICQTSALPGLGKHCIFIPVRRNFNYVLVTSKNLRRIREAHGLTQPALAAMIGSTPGRISAYETGADPMGTDYIERVCKALGDVEFWEFVVDDNTPILKDPVEKYVIERWREAAALGVAEDVAKYEAFVIQQARENAMPLRAAKEDPLAAKRKKFIELYENVQEKYPDLIPEVDENLLNMGRSKRSKRSRAAAQRKK